MKRSKKWISTSILESEPKEEILKYASAEYFVNNLISPVYFYDKLKELPSDAIIIEIGPHAVFRKIINETLETASYLSLIKKDSNDTNLDNFFVCDRELSMSGDSTLQLRTCIQRLSFPVSRNTPTIGSLIKWDHSVQYIISANIPKVFNRNTASDMNVCHRYDSKLTIVSTRVIVLMEISFFLATGYLVVSLASFLNLFGQDLGKGAC